jgi:hypothetical protein
LFLDRVERRVWKVVVSLMVLNMSMGVSGVAICMPCCSLSSPSVQGGGGVDEGGWGCCKEGGEEGVDGILYACRVRHGVGGGWVDNRLKGFRGIRVVEDLPMSLLPVGVVSVLELCSVSVLRLLSFSNSESCNLLFDCPQVLDVTFP